MTEFQSSAVTRILKQRFQSGSRFGHSINFSDLFSDEDARKSYIEGLVAVSLTLLSLFLFWGFLLVSLKVCFGPRRVGFLSGAPFQTTVKTQSANDDDNAGGAVRFENPWIGRGRAIFATSCLLIIVFSIVLVTAGLGNMDETNTSIGQGASIGYDYLNTAEVTLTQVITALAFLSKMKEDLLTELKDFYQDLQVASLLYQTGNVEATVKTLVISMEDLEDFLQSSLNDIKYVLSDGQQTFQSVATVTDEISLKGVQAGVGLVMTTIPALLLFCMCWKAYQTNPHRGLDIFRACFLWPTFVLMIILCLIFCCAITIGGLLNADFCSGGNDQSPDSTIIEILDNQGTDPNSHYYKTAVYVINDCTVNELSKSAPFDDVEGLERQINATLMDLAKTIDAIILTGVEVLSNETGKDVSFLTAHLQEFNPRLKDLFEMLGRFINSLACKPMYEVYYMVTHQAACIDSYTGTFWIFVSLICISFFGLMAITFRSVLYPIATIEQGCTSQQNDEQPVELFKSDTSKTKLHDNTSTTSLATGTTCQANSPIEKSVRVKKMAVGACYVAGESLDKQRDNTSTTTFPSLATGTTEDDGNTSQEVVFTDLTPWL